MEMPANFPLAYSIQRDPIWTLYSIERNSTRNSYLPEGQQGKSSRKAARNRGKNPTIAQSGWILAWRKKTTVKGREKFEYSPVTHKIISYMYFANKILKRYMTFFVKSTNDTTTCTFWIGFVLALL
jgi:hypothetical protein